MLRRCGSLCYGCPLCYVIVIRFMLAVVVIIKIIFILCALLILGDKKIDKKYIWLSEKLSEVGVH